MGRAEEIHKRKELIQLEIDNLNKLALQDERKEELEMAAAAKNEAERIQAEAKARARVSGEASNLQIMSSSAATKAYSLAVEKESKLKDEVAQILLAYYEKVKVKDLRQTEVRRIEAFLS